MTSVNAMTTTETEKSPVANRARFRAWFIDTALEDIQDSDAELSDEQREILKQAEAGLVNIQRVLDELRSNLS